MLDALLSDAEIALRQAHCTSFIGLLAIEDNPLTPDDVVMFDMFDRERWSEDRCRRHIIGQLRKPA